MAIITKAERIAAAVQVQVNDVMIQMFPELLPEAHKIVSSEEMMIAKFPNNEKDIKELCQLKLDTLALRFRLDRIKEKRDVAQVEVVKKVKAWAKSKPYGAYLDSKGILCHKKMIKGFKGKDWVYKMVEAYNAELVPFSNNLRAEMGAEYTPDEKAQGEKLNTMLVKHNQLVMRNQHLLKAI